MINRKILLIGRHGKAPQKPAPEVGSLDELFPESVTRLYENTGVPLRDFVSIYGVKQENSFLRHTKKVRTLYTGQAVLAGAFGMSPLKGTNPPRRQENLQNYDWSHFSVAPDQRFMYGHPDVNLRIYKEKGPEANVNFWLEHPEATWHEDEPIESYLSVSSRCKNGMKDIHSLLLNHNDLGILVSHVCMTEVTIIPLINSGLKTPIGRVEDIRGCFDMEEFATLTIDITRGGLHTATLEYKDIDHKINFNNY